MKKTFSIVIILCLSCSSLIRAEKIPYNHQSIKIEELIQKVDFKVLIPKNTPENCTIEIKTYPVSETDHFTEIRLHYMDKDDQVLLVGIEEKKTTSNQVRLTDQDGETVRINGNVGFYRRFANYSGGILTWIEENTLIEMDSNIATKQEMIDMAGSMEVAQ